MIVVVSQTCRNTWSLQLLMLSGCVRAFSQHIVHWYFSWEMVPAGWSFFSLSSVSFQMFILLWIKLFVLMGKVRVTGLKLLTPVIWCRNAMFRASCWIHINQNILPVKKVRIKVVMPFLFHYAFCLTKLSIFIVWYHSQMIYSRTVKQTEPQQRKSYLKS